MKAHKAAVFLNQEKDQAAQELKEISQQGGDILIKPGAGFGCGYRRRWARLDEGVVLHYKFLLLEKAFDPEATGLRAGDIIPTSAF
jgi:hypothetical protein